MAVIGKELIAKMDEAIEKRKAMRAVVREAIDSAHCEISFCRQIAMGAAFYQFGPDDDPDAVHFFCRDHLRQVCGPTAGSL